MTSDKTGPALLSQKRSTCCGSISWRTKKSETKPNFRNPLCACILPCHTLVPPSRSSSGVVFFLGPLGEHDPDQFVHRRALDDCRGRWPWSWGAGDCHHKVTKLDDSSVENIHEDPIYKRTLDVPRGREKKIPGEIRHLIYTYSCILVYKWAGKTSAFFSDRRLFPFPRCQKPANPLRSRAPTLWRPCQVLFRWTFFSEILVTGWWNPIIIYIYITHTQIYIYIYTHTPIYTNEINPFDSKSSARQRRFRSPPLSLQPLLGSLVTISTKCWEDMAFSGAKESEMQSLNSWIMLHAALRRDWKRPSWTIH